MNELKKTIKNLCFEDEWGGNFSMYGNKDYFTITNYPESEFPQMSIVFYDDYLGEKFCESTLYTDGDYERTETITGLKKQLSKFKKLKKNN